MASPASFCSHAARRRHFVPYLHTSGKNHPHMAYRNLRAHSCLCCGKTACSNIGLRVSNQNIGRPTLSNRMHSRGQVSSSHDLLLGLPHHTTSCARFVCHRSSLRGNYLLGTFLARCFLEMEIFWVLASQDKRHCVLRRCVGSHHFPCCLA